MLHVQYAHKIGTKYYKGVGHSHLYYSLSKYGFLVTLTYDTYHVDTLAYFSRRRCYLH